VPQPAGVDAGGGQVREALRQRRGERFAADPFAARSRRLLASPSFGMGADRDAARAAITSALPSTRGWGHLWESA